MWGTIASGTIGAIAGLWNNHSTNASNSKEAQKQREWEEGMSNTAHQREVEDLKKAGLNPALSTTGGSGASTPAGAMATFDKSDVVNDTLTSAMAKLEYKKYKEDINKTKEEIKTEKTIQDKNKKESEAINQNINKNKPSEKIMNKANGYLDKLDKGYERQRAKGYNKVWSAISSFWS